MTPAKVAQRLRADLQALSPETVAARAQWLHRQQQKGCNTKHIFDPRALTFISSSWNFDWEGVDFNAAPVCFDHGALTPVAVVFVPRPQGDGVNVYTSGPQNALEDFAA